jgi:hypothetical protein
MSPQQGHRARKTQAAERQARAERALQLQKLGTRAVVAQALADEAEKVDRTVRHLLSAAAEGDLASAKALTAYFDQALGRPTERHEHRTPTGLEDLESMPHEELERLVAHGRAQRLGLRAAPEPGVGELDGAGDDVADVGQLLPRVP